MDDSTFNPVLLSSSAHLENVEQLIKNLEKQTFNADNLEDALNKQTRHESTTKSLSLPIDTNLLIKSISLPDSATVADRDDENTLIDNLLAQCNLFDNDELKKQQTSSTNDPSLFNDQDIGYIWDDQYDARANYRLTFSTDKPQQTDVKSEKSRRHKYRSIGQKLSPTYSDDDVANNMNDWSMRSSFNAFEQLINQPQQIYTQSNPYSSSSQQPVPNNHSSESSTTSSSTSWRQMKESQRTTTGIETRETRPPSPLNLYKIFQQKSNITASSFRGAVPLNRHSILPNHTNEITTEKSKSSQTHLSTDQAIQTSILLDSSSDSRYRTTSVTVPKSESSCHLTAPTPVLAAKSLPDLSFISQYAKELPRSRTTSPSSSTVNIARATPSPILIQHQKPDSDRPRTLKSIKRYKNSKHSTEPLGVFYSPQLHKTFTALPTSTVITGSSTPIRNTATSASFFSSQTQQQQQSHLKSCLRYGSRANSCDIQEIAQDRKSPIPSLSIPLPASDKDSISSSFQRRSSDANGFKYPDTIWPSKIHSNKLSTYILPNSFRGHRSEYDLTSLIQRDNQTKKSVSFSEDISKHLVSPCNPTIAFNDNLRLALYENNERITKRATVRYRDMRRCQTDIIVVDPVLHLHSFTDSPPNEFCLQQDDDDDEVLMENSHINIIPKWDEPVPIINIVPSSPLYQTEFVSIEKENKPSISIDTSTLDLVGTVNNIIKRLFEIKRSDKTFFLDNEQNLQLDSLLKNDLCSVIQSILEHGRKDLKKVTLWKIIEASIDKNTSVLAQVPRVYCEAKQIAQNTSSYWLYKYQAFIFALLNKNELINWLYYFTRQKDIIHHYYQPPDALILVAISSTFNLFERIMTQLEKLAPLAFRLTYHAPNISSINGDQLNTSMISTHSTKPNARDWVMTISRRSSKMLTQPVIPANSNDTFRSTLSRKFNAFFTKTNTAQPSRSSSVVTPKLPELKKHMKSPGTLHRPRFSSVFNNPLTTVTTNRSTPAPSPKLNNSVRQTTPPSIRTSATFQSKIPRPSLNVDKPKSARYRSGAPSQK